MVDIPGAYDFRRGSMAAGKVGGCFHPLSIVSPKVSIP